MFEIEGYFPITKPELVEVGRGNLERTQTVFRQNAMWIRRDGLQGASELSWDDVAPQSWNCPANSWRHRTIQLRQCFDACLHREARRADHRLSNTPHINTRMKFRQIPTRRATLSPPVITAILFLLPSNVIENQKSFPLLTPAGRLGSTTSIHSQRGGNVLRPCITSFHSFRSIAAFA